eukprot:Gb_04840 [translate_table: standard]
MMNPRAFVKVSVGGLALRIPAASKPARSGVHAASFPCFCEIKLSDFPLQTAPVPLITPTSASPDFDSHKNLAASFYIDESALQKLVATTCIGRASKLPCLEVTVYTGRQGTSCGVGTGKQLGKFLVPVELEWAEGRPVQIHNGWINIGKPKAEGGRPGAELHLSIIAEPDPRYIFQFGGQPELSPQIFQLQGSIRQPIFSCKFSRDRDCRARLGQHDGSSNGWTRSMNSEKERKERKGWLIIIHDLSGSPVAAASMVTPFVPSAGTDRVSRSNPGAWLILRQGPPGEDSWRPWGRLQAWRERGSKGGLGCRFQLMAEGSGLTGVGTGLLLSETVISYQKGGMFMIDTGKFRAEASASPSPVESPRSSGDFNLHMALPLLGGFVMSATVKGEGKGSKLQVQLAMRHVNCVDDAAVFMALAAAVELSVDACQPFSKKLRKELTQSDPLP